MHLEGHDLPAVSEARWVVLTQVNLGGEAQGSPLVLKFSGICMALMEPYLIALWRSRPFALLCTVAPRLDIKAISVAANVHLAHITMSL